MSDETVSSPENLPSPTVQSAPPARRISNPRPKKASKGDSSENPIAPSDTENENFQPSKEHEDASAEFSPAGADWPQPEADSPGGSPSQTESAKRKRRRRKGKGSSAVPPVEDRSASLPVVAETPKENRPRAQHEPQPTQRLKIDSELLSQMAWKIYLAEVSEEGVALISDNDAKDLARRCFRLAEIFIEEQIRKR